MDSFIQSIGPIQSITNRNLYFYVSPRGLHAPFILYVDNIMIVDDNIQMLNEIEKSLEQKYKMSHLGKLSLHIGL